MIKKHLFLHTHKKRQKSTLFQHYLNNQTQSQHNQPTKFIKKHQKTKHNNKIPRHKHQTKIHLPPHQQKTTKKQPFPKIHKIHKKYTLFQQFLNNQITSF